MTSVGSGSLMIVLLLFIYPTIGANQLVGTDLTQAVPLTLAAALGALAFGHVELVVTGSLILGSVPAVLVGSMLSSTVPDRYIRPAIAFVIFASGLKYVGVATTALGWMLCAIAARGAAVAWLVYARPWRSRRPLPANPTARRRPPTAPRRPSARSCMIAANRRPGRTAVSLRPSGSAAHRPDAPVVLAIHGITSSSRSWLAVARALGDAAALVAVDLRGRGRGSGYRDRMGSTPTFTTWSPCSTSSGSSAAVVAGHSLGAYIACALALAHPERVSELVLVDGGSDDPRERRRRSRTVRRAVSRPRRSRAWT